MIPKHTDIAIITKDTVLKTFDNQDAHLHAVIEPISDDPQQQVRTYKVRTDLAVYKDIEVTTLDADGNPTTETKQQLTLVEQKQDWSLQRITYAEIDAFAVAVASQIPSGLSKTEVDLLQLKLVFLAQRKQKKMWGVATTQWRLRTDDDLIK